MRIRSDRKSIKSSHTFFAISAIWMGISLFTLPGTAAHKTRSETPYRVEEFSVSTPVQLSVRTSGGHIEVQSQNSNKVRVEMYVEKNGHFLTSSDTDLKDYDITIKQDGNHVTAYARHQSHGFSLFGNDNDHISISFVVYTPKKTSSDLNTSGGHIKLQGLDGETDANTSGGHIEADDLNGNVKLRTSGGHISISGFSGTMDARTSGGSIHAENGQGKMSLHTSGGHIDLNDVSGRIEAETSGGSISATVQKVDELLSLRTSGGSVRARVPANQGYDIELDGNSVDTNLQNFNGTIRHDHVEGKIGNGGPRIVLRTSGGSVTLEQS